MSTLIRIKSNIVLNTVPLNVFSILETLASIVRKIANTAVARIPADLVYLIAISIIHLPFRIIGVAFR
jgi:hypothetical protein